MRGRRLRPRRGGDGRLGEAKAAGRGRRPPPLSVRVGEDWACFPECFPEKGIACEPVPDFEDVPVGEFYQDAVPFQIQCGFPHDAAAGEGVEYGFALPGHELEDFFAQGQREFALVYLVLPCDGRDVEHGGEHLRGAAHVLGRPGVFCLFGIDAQAARLAFREYHHVLGVLGLAPGIADKVPLFPGDFRVVEQPALFGVFLDLVEVVVVVLVFGGEDFDEEAAVLEHAGFFPEVVERVPEAVVSGEVAVAALVGLLVEPRVVGQDAVDGGVSEHGEVAAVAFYHDAAFVALDCLVQALGDALEFYAEVVVDARADGFLRLVGVFGIGVLEREFALVLETGVDGVCE